MTSEPTRMKSIWYLVSLVLMEMGGLVLIAGIIELFAPSPRRTVLAEIHPGIWWGCVMIVAGVIFYVRNRNKSR
jgi:hypothetical protein